MMGRESLRHKGLQGAHTEQNDDDDDDDDDDLSSILFHTKNES
jgi:hypothetical protein